ncbi:MAG: hypothetical protein LUQ17_04980 [Methanomicrobiales archaeon]|nr:hypothetical protein [Methanomicrobiales archaeon]
MDWEKEKERYGKEIIRDLYSEGMIRTWFRDNPKGWRLMSGLWSPFYIQLRPLSCYPPLLKKVGTALGALVTHEIPETSRLVGIAMAGIPLATAITLMEGIPSGFTRKLEGVHTLPELQTFLATYGEHALVEGVFEEGDRVVLVDDLATKFDSKLIALGQVRSEMERRRCGGVVVNDVVVLLDREQGAQKTARDHGIELHSLIPFRSKGLRWLSEFISAQEFAVISDYLADTAKYQNPVLQDTLFRIAIEKRSE